VRKAGAASDARDCECRQPDCFKCELAGTREWLAAQGLHIVTAVEWRTVKAAREAGAYFGAAHLERVGTLEVQLRDTRRQLVTAMEQARAAEKRANRLGHELEAARGKP
jgi:hypothetical protein